MIILKLLNIISILSSPPSPSSPSPSGSDKVEHLHLLHASWASSTRSSSSPYQPTPYHVFCKDKDNDKYSVWSDINPNACLYLRMYCVSWIYWVCSILDSNILDIIAYVLESECVFRLIGWASYFEIEKHKSIRCRFNMCVVYIYESTYWVRRICIWYQD